MVNTEGTFAPGTSSLNRSGIAALTACTHLTASSPLCNDMTAMGLVFCIYKPDDGICDRHTNTIVVKAIKKKYLINNCFPLHYFNSASHCCANVLAAITASFPAR